MPVAIAAAILFAVAGPVPEGGAPKTAQAARYDVEEPILPPDEINRLVNAGDLIGALALAERSLRACAPHPEVTPRCILLLITAATLATTAGDPALGETRAKQAIGLAGAYGVENTNVYSARARLSLAKSFVAQRRYAEAQEQGQTARAILARLGPEHALGVATADIMIGQIALARGDGVLARSYFESAAGIAARVTGKHDHFMVAIAYGYVGSSLEELGLGEEAEPYLQFALSALRKSFPETHDLIARASVNLGRCLSTLGRWDEADRHLRRGIAIYRIVAGENAPQLAPAYTSLATNLIRQDRLREAEPFLRRAYAVAVANNDDESRFVTLAALAELERKRGNFALAEIYLRHALAIHHQIDGPTLNFANTFFGLSEAWTQQGIYPIQSYLMFEQGMDLLKRRRLSYEDAGERETSDRETRRYGNDYEFQIRLAWNAGQAVK